MEYVQLSQQLADIGLDAGPAEMHGIYCGMLCGGIADPETGWLTEVFEDHDPQDLLVQECARALACAANETREAISGPGMGFMPLLPDDSQPLPSRAQALAEWCQGFLYGLGTTGITDSMLSPETAEALRDLAAIAQMDGETGPGSEEEDEAYMELQEFVWVAAMLTYEERARGNDQ